MSGFDDTLSVIDFVISDEPTPNCQQCGRARGDSPSGDFCSENCQRVWRGRHTAAQPAADGSAHPSELPETAPVTPLTWLGPAPAGAFAKPGHEVLDAVVTFVSRFSAFANEHAAPTLALWYAHTHVAERLYVTPRLILDSAEPGSGKTRVLEVAQYLVAKPEMTISITPAAIFRMLADGPMTLLFDEIDAVFNPKTGGNNIEDGPWTDLQGKPLDSGRLAKELDRYLVRPKDLKVSGKTLKGYRIDGDGGLADAWSRYLPPLETGATSATSATPQVSATSGDAEAPGSAATSATRVADGCGTQQPLTPVLTSPVAEVADVAFTKPEHDTEGDR